MERLKRQVIVLALCLAAVLTARFYVGRFLEQQRTAEDEGQDAGDEASGLPVAQDAPAAPVGSAGLTVETPAPPPPAAADGEADDAGPASGKRPVAKAPTDP